MINLNLMYSPLEQFKVLSIYYFPLFTYLMTNIDFFFFLLFNILITLGFWLFIDIKVIPDNFQSIIELMYNFVKNMINDNMGIKGEKYFPFIFLILLIITSCNFMGMIPYNFTLTSHFALTFGISVSLLLGATIIGFKQHGLHFFSFFMPPGAPLGLAPMLVSIELISYIFRALSLSIRLFANMMAGHTLLKIISTFTDAILSMGGNFYIFCSLIPIILIFGFIGLELCIAFLQAYVFTILICLYLKDAIYLH